jgi:methyl acetate hydrolase
MNAARLDRLLGASVDSGDVPGVIAVVGSKDGLVYQGAFGRRDIGKPQPMTADTVVWIASMTKAVTTVAVMQLVQRGLIDLDQPASRYVPEIGATGVIEGFETDGRPRLRPARRPPSVRELLVHTSGYGYDFANPLIRQYLKATGTPSTASNKKASLAIPLLADPGEAFSYGIGIDWAGLIVEAVSGKSLEAYFADHIFSPLGMTDTMFVLGESQHARRATVHAITEDASLVATDIIAAQEPEFFMGGGGLYSTAGDYLAFARMLLNDGVGNGERLLKAQTVADMAIDQLPGLSVPTMTLNSPTGLRKVDFFPGMGQGWGLSFLINREKSPEGRAAGSLAWGGFANTYYWIDRQSGIAGILLTQIVPFFDPKVVRLFRAFETAVYADR